MSQQGSIWLLQSSMNILYRRIRLEGTRVSIHSTRGGLALQWASKAPGKPPKHQVTLQGSRWASTTPEKHFRLHDVTPEQPWSVHCSRLSLQSSGPRLQGSLVTIQDSRMGLQLLRMRILGSRVSPRSFKITHHCSRSAFLVFDLA